MSEFFDQKQKQQQQFAQKQAAEIQQQSTATKTMTEQAYTTKETMDVAAIQQVVSANAYLQGQRDDAEPAAPDEAREELLAKQMTVGLGKSAGMKQARDAAAGDNN